MFPLFSNFLYAGQKAYFKEIIVLYDRMVPSISPVSGNEVEGGAIKRSARHRLPVWILLESRIIGDREE